MLKLDQLLEAVDNKKPLNIDINPYTEAPTECRLNFIGDVHGAKSWYKKMCNTSKISTQLGDVNNSPKMYEFFEGLDPNNHKYIHGNHDWLENPTPHYLGEYGIWNIEGLKIGFISGAYSIDAKRRACSHTDPIHENEELSYSTLIKALELIKEEQPNVIISHSAPNLAYDRLTLLPQYSSIFSRTGNALNSIMNECSPSLWVFGHYHQNTNFVYQNRTTFACVDKNNTLPMI